MVSTLRAAPGTRPKNEKRAIFDISSRTGECLEPAADKANWNIFVIARKNLRYELSGAFPKALRQMKAITLRGLKVGTHDDDQNAWK